MSRDESREYSLYTYNGRDISPNRSVLTTSSNWQMRPDKGLDVSREGFYKGKSESQSVLNTSLIVRPKVLYIYSYLLKEIGAEQGRKCLI